MSERAQQCSGRTGVGALVCPPGSEAGRSGLLGPRLVVLRRNEAQRSVAANCNCGKTHDVKCTVLTIFTCRFRALQYIHTVVHLSLPFYPVALVIL